MRSLSHRRRSLDIWPGFVDALSSLIMVMVFVLLIFAVGQFVLSQTLVGKNKALADLNEQIAALAKTLALTQSENASLSAKTQELNVSLGAVSNARDVAQLALTQREAEIAKLTADIAALSEFKQKLESQIASLGVQLDDSKKDLVAKTDLAAQSAAQMELLNRQLVALRDQLGQLTASLDLANANSKSKDAKIDDLGKQLNLALANKVNELVRYRSEFFGKLKEALGNRPDIRVVGDRFMVSSDILFESGAADLGPQAKIQLVQLAQTLKEVTAEVPSKIDWVLRIDGHTDKRPIRTERFPSNWELSTARAVAIVKYLVVQGIPAHRLAANGFGEFQPVDTAMTDEAYARNRRIEIQLTNR